MRSTGRVHAVPGGLLVLGLLLSTVGCGGGADGSQAAEPGAAPSASRPPAPAEPSDPGSSDPSGPPEGRLRPQQVPAADPPPCDDVRAGIDAFNQGDPGETVRLFEDALPAAEAYAAEEPGRTADLLLEAVRYYAALPPQDYAAAITGSQEFRRHQVVTLSVCRYGQGSSPPSDDAVPA